MKIVKTENKLCPNCNEKHDVQTVIVTELTKFHGKDIRYSAEYDHCDFCDSLTTNKAQNERNYVSLREAYGKMNLATYQSKI